MTDTERNKLVAALGELFEFRGKITDPKLADAMDTAIDEAFEAFGSEVYETPVGNPVCSDCADGIGRGYERDWFRNNHPGDFDCYFCGKAFLCGENALRKFRKGVTA